MFENRRCLIPANGFYEWQAAPDGKSPVWIHRADDQPFAFAGLYAHDTATVVMTDANSQMSPAHHRMPVILSPDECDVDGQPQGADGPSLEGIEKASKYVQS